MKVKIKLLIICLFIVNYLFSADVDVNLTIPEDYGIDFPSALHLDRLYFAVEGENGNLELLTESDLNIGVATSTFGSVNLCLLYYGNLANPYATRLQLTSVPTMFSSEITTLLRMYVRMGLIENTS